MKALTYSALAASLAALLISAVAAGAQTGPYSQAVANLNPVGYWPMHETTSAGPGDIETNIGTAGALANGYYGDWGAPAPVSPITHGWPGALAGDTDPCVNFNFSYGSGSGAKGSATNCLIIPHTSPAATLIPPFSVECWYFFTNSFGSGKQSDIWSSVNANGSEPGLNGVSAYSGIRLYFNNNLVVYTYDNNGGVNSANSSSTIAYGTAAQWTYLVVTDDGTNITVYDDGNVVLNGIPNSTYAPNYWDPFQIDTGKGFTRDASGLLDEFAIYTNALSQTDIAAHYAAGTNANPAVPYKTLVLNDNPTIYYRMDSPAYTIPPRSVLPVLTNYGSASVNGFYEPGVAPGAVAGPNNGVTFAAGFGTNTNAMPGNGMSSYADAGFASAFNPTGTSAFSISAWFKGGPCDSRTQTIVGRGTNSWSIVMTTTGHLQCLLGSNANNSVTSTGVYNDGNWHHVVDVYSPNATAGQTGTNAIYVDGVLDNLTGSVSASGILPGTNLDMLIGSDPQFTNILAANATLASLGRQFAGNICEVALFNAALTAGQIQALYNAAEMPPMITQQPVAGVVNQGSGFTNKVVATGALPLSYQWFSNAVALANQTNASLVLNPVLPAYSGNYYVIVSNSYGSVTSALVSLAVNSAATILAQFPIAYTNVFTVYAGANPTFSILASGALPIYYQWFTNNMLDGAATNSSLTLTNVEAGAMITNYYCVVSNLVGSATSSNWAATVIADPTNAMGLAPYPQMVLALNPIGYWRLNEPEMGGGDAGDLCFDYAGGNNGIYTNVYLGYLGYNPIADPTDTSVDVGAYAANNSYSSQIGTNMDFALPAGGNAKFSVEAWASLLNNSLTKSPQGVGIVCKGNANGGEEFALDTTGSGPFRFFVRSANGTQYSASPTNAAVVNTFYHLVGVCDEANSNVSLYINGALAARTTIPPLSGINNGSAVSMTIGARSPNPSAISQQMFGYLNDVAVFNYALNSNQIFNEYFYSGLPPSITQQPFNTTNVGAGQTVTVSVAATGTPPLFYQWIDGGTSQPIAGQTNATLVISNDLANDSYYVAITNFYGAIDSGDVFVNVYTSPDVVQDITPPGTTAVQGSTVTFAVEVVGESPLTYGWQFNGNALANGTRISGAYSNVLTIADVQNSDAGTYQLFITNSAGNGQSSPATLTVAPTLNFNGTGLGWTTQSTLSGNWYGNNLLGLTDGSANEDTAVFYNSPVYIGNFEASFSYQVPSGPTGSADGATFCIQNDPRGAAAIGGDGGSLGVGTGTTPPTGSSPITPSVELEFNIYSANGVGGVGISFDTNGTIGPVISTAPVIINSGDYINAALTYLNGQLTITLADTTANPAEQFALSTNVNIPSLVGGDNAYVGFTGSDGGSESSQQISNFSFESLAGLAVQKSNGAAILSWPAAIGGYVLQQNPSLLSTNWTTVTNAVSFANGINQVQVSPANTAFYRLYLQP